MLGKGHEHEPLGPDLHLPVRDNVSIFLPPPRRAPNRVALAAGSALPRAHMVLRRIGNGSCRPGRSACAGRPRPS
jgi:hypothetical protein